MTKLLPRENINLTYVSQNPKCSRRIFQTMESHNNSEQQEDTNAKKNIPPDITNIPSEKSQTTLNEIQKTITDCVKRSSSCLENKYKCTITSDRLAQLRKNVETAIKDHKVFTIKGCWPVIRRELLKRNWIEKYEHSPNKAKSANPSSSSNDNLVENLPPKQDWESPTAYIEKCEKMVMSRMLQSYDVDLYWSMRKDHSDLLHRANCYKLINRFCRSLFASKEGLALLLQQAYWYTEPSVSSINFPRCYVLGFPEHYNFFLDDYRLTACMGLIKWFILKYEKEDKFAIMSPEGQVPLSALQFAIDRCTDYIASQRHMDIDKEENRIWDHEWEQFITNYSKIMYKNMRFIDSKKHSVNSLYSNARSVIMDMRIQWPDMDIDGMRNIWIMKPGNKCRGKGIQLIRDIVDVERIMNLKLKYVVQKYIEKPLVIYKTKFDIRQWFIVTSAQPLVIWMYRDSYLRFSSQIFNLENFHESLHLTNYAVQCKYTNMEHRDKALPADNMWDCHTFREYLSKIGHPEAWNNIIYPGMRESIICSMLCSQETMDRRQNTFEVYGADFMLSEDFRPWLLEINCCPDLSSSTSVTKKMCPSCMEDILKVVVDRRRDPKASTGLFDLIYRQNLPKTPPYLGMNLSIRGRKLFKSRKPKPKSTEKENHPNDEPNLLRRRRSLHVDLVEESVLLEHLPEMLSPHIYKGPVIQDLIENLKKSYDNPEENGWNFIPAAKTEPKKKPQAHTAKKERVSKKECNYHKPKLNKPSFYRKPNASKNTREDKYNSKLAVRTLQSHELTHKLSMKRRVEIGGLKEEIASIWGRNKSCSLEGKHFVNKCDNVILDKNLLENNNNIPLKMCVISSLSTSLPDLNANKINKNLKSNLSLFSLNVSFRHKKSASGQ